MRPHPVRVGPHSAISEQGHLVGVVAGLFRDLWRNEDVRKYKTALRVLAGDHVWLEEGILTLEDQLRAPAGPLAEPEPPVVAPKARPVTTH